MALTLTLHIICTYMKFKANRTRLAVGGKNPNKFVFFTFSSLKYIKNIEYGEIQHSG